MSRPGWLIGAAVILVGAALGPAMAQQVVKREPALGAMKPGERLLLDDGSCGPGKIKEVVGGDQIKVGGRSNIVPQRPCIPH